MAREGIKRNLDFLNVLTQKEVEDIHGGTLKVLKETGVVFDDEDALKLFAENGCDVDFQNKRVRFSEKTIMDCLAKTPSSYIVQARDIENNVNLASGETAFFSVGAALNSVDLDTWEIKEPTRKDFYDYIRILEALPHFDIQGPCAYYGFKNVPQCMRFIEANAAKLRVSTKVQWEGSVMDNYIFNMAMGKATGNEIIQLANPVAPLTLYKDTITNIRYFAENDVPFSITTGSLIGSTGPATLAGTLISDNANCLASIALAQLIKPGTRVIAGGMIMAQNMKTGEPGFGDIANSLIGSAYNQIWRYYKVPTFNTPCGWSSSKTIDYQASYENAIPVLTNALSGCNSINSYGGLTAELTGHPVKAILDDDIAGMVKRYLKGIEVTEETMAVDLINKTGPVPGHFLTSPHTFKWWKKECYIPQTADRLSMSDWMKKGKKKAIDIAREKMEGMLANNNVVALPAEQEQAIEDILKEARGYYRKKGLISDDEWKQYQEDINSPNYPFA